MWKKKTCSRSIWRAWISPGRNVWEDCGGQHHEAGARGGGQSGDYVQEAKGVQSLVEWALRFLTAGWPWEDETGGETAPHLALSDGFAVLTSTLPPVAPRGCLPAGPQTRRWDTVHGSSLALKWTWPCPDGAQSIPAPNWCWCSLKFPGVTWQLLKYEPSLWSPPTSCLLAPDLTSPQAFPCTFILLNVHIILWRVGTTCYPILLMGKQRLTLVVK